MIYYWQTTGPPALVTLLKSPSSLQVVIKLYTSSTVTVIVKRVVDTPPVQSNVSRITHIGIRTMQQVYQPCFCEIQRPSELPMAGVNKT